MAQSSETSPRDYYHEHLSDDQQANCMLYGAYRDAVFLYFTTQHERQILQSWFDISQTSQHPLAEDARLARDRILNEARGKEDEARAKMVELAKLIIEAPIFELGICDVEWVRGRWWFSFRAGHVVGGSAAGA